MASKLAAGWKIAVVTVWDLALEAPMHDFDCVHPGANEGAASVADASRAVCRQLVDNSTLCDHGPAQPGSVGDKHWQPRQRPQGHVGVGGCCLWSRNTRLPGPIFAAACTSRA